MPVGVNFVISGFAHTHGGACGSLDPTHFAGGRTIDPQQRPAGQLAVGGTLSLPVNANRSVKFCFSSGVATRTGNGFDSIGAAWL